MALKGIRRPGGGGGGFLNGVAGVLVDYTFKVDKTGVTKKGEPWSTVSVELLVQPDGGEVVKQFADLGFVYGENAISKDGKSITAAKYQLDGDTTWGEFVISLFEGEGNRLPEELWDATELGRNYAAVMGTRVTFARLIDEARTFERGIYHYEKKHGTGSAKKAEREAVIEAGKRPGKKGTPAESQRFMLDKLLVADVLAGPTAKAGKATKAAAKATVAAPVVDVDAVLTAVLGAAADKTIEKGKLGVAVLRYTVSNKFAKDAQDAVRKQIGDDAYLADAEKRKLIIIDGTTIALAVAA